MVEKRELGKMKKLATKLALMVAVSTLAFASPAFAHMGESHEVDSATAPTVSLSVDKDEIGGYNVFIDTTNFTWAPERASQEHIAGEGHAHIYVDGVKVGRVYSSWYHLNTAGLNLEPGTHLVEVNLNGNDHGPYTVAGEEVRAGASIEITAGQATPMPTMAEMGSQDMFGFEGQNLLLGIVSFLLGALLSALGFYFVRAKRK
jgi:hypothetical protein